MSREGRETPQLSIAGSLRLWDVFLQEGWLHALRRARPDVAIWAEAGQPEALISRLFDGLLDVVVMLEPPRVELMTTMRLTQIDLVLVSTESGQAPEDALGDGYAMVDWGQAFEVEHRRLFPHAPAALTTLSNSGMALDYLRALGGAAYLPGRVIARDLAAGSLFVVKDAPLITRHVYGIYLSRNPKLELILQALDVISPGHRIAPELVGGG